MTLPSIRVIIPAYNEEESIGLVLQEIPTRVKEAIVISNASTDRTAENALKNGATVLQEPVLGYGRACLTGIKHVNRNAPETDIIVFMDGDYSDYPEKLVELTQPIEDGKVDFVVGARVSRFRESGSMTIPQRFGNWLSTRMMQAFFGSRFTDLGPFRAIKLSTLNSLHMQDKNYGWTVEMQLKVLKQNIPYTEVPVPYRNRTGVSKVSGTVKGSIMAGVKILWWIFKYGFKR